MATASDSTTTPAVQPGLLRSRPERPAEIFGPVVADSARQQVGPVYTADNLPPFDDWPAVYGLRCFGDCCEPEIADGSSVVIDRQASHANGDFVAIWSLTAGGEIRAFVKRLVAGLAPWTRLPYRRDPRSELHPVLIVEKLKPPQSFEVDLSMVYAVHRCIGVAAARPDVAIGTTIPEADIQWFDRKSRPARARTAGGHLA